MKVAIVGGGIMGTSIALELARPGLEVTVLERSIPGAEASTAAAGMLAPQLEASGPGPMLELSLRSRGLYPAWVERLHAETGVDVGYLPSGALQLASDAAQAHALDAAVAWQQAAGLRAALLSQDELRALEPGAGPQLVAAASFPDDHQVDPRRLMDALSRALRRKEVALRSGTVEGLLEAGGAVTGVQLTSGEVHADVTVIAAGAWAAQVPGVGVDAAQLVPARGQLIEFELATPPVRRLLKAGLSYVVPRASGRVICGTTVELVGFDKRTTDEGLASIREQAALLCPALSGAREIASWAGLRPWTHDGLPLLGPSSRRGLVIASGHARNGILLAPLTARLIAQLILGQKPSVDLRPFRPERLNQRQAEQPPPARQAAPAASPDTPEHP